MPFRVESFLGRNVLGPLLLRVLFHRVLTIETPIGRVPAEDAIDTAGLDLAPGAMRELTAVNASEWMHETEDVEGFFATFGEHLPAELEAERKAWVGRLSGD